MTPALHNAIKSYAVAQGVGALADARRVDAALPVFAGKAAAAERAAFLACLSGGLPAKLAQTPDAASRAACVDRAARQMSGAAEASPELAREIAALVESLCPAGKPQPAPRPQAAPPAATPAPPRPIYTPPPARQQNYAPPPEPAPAAASAGQPLSRAGGARVPNTKTVAIAVGAVAVVALVALLLAANSANGWQGYATYEEFARGRYIELWGRPLDEEGFRALMALAFLGSSSTDEIDFDIVSGDKLSGRYGVPAKLRQYNYLSKKNYIAFYNGAAWIVVHFTPGKKGE